MASNIVLHVCVLFLGAKCSDSDGAPMLKTEQNALYAAIQGFVGKWWNGSDLYPDPCGWTPIQVLFVYYSFVEFCICFITVSLSYNTPSLYLYGTVASLYHTDNLDSIDLCNSIMLENNFNNIDVT